MRSTKFIPLGPPGPRETAAGLHQAILQRVGIPLVSYPGGMVSGWITVSNTTITYAVTPLGLWQVSDDPAIAYLAEALNVLCNWPQRINAPADTVQAVLYSSARGTVAGLPTQKVRAISTLEALAQGVL